MPPFRGFVCSFSSFSSFSSSVSSLSSSSLFFRSSSSMADTQVNFEGLRQLQVFDGEGKKIDFSSLYAEKVYPFFLFLSLSLSLSLLSPLFFF